MALRVLAALTSLALRPVFELVARLLHPADAAQRILVHLVPPRAVKAQAAAALSSSSKTDNLGETESPLASAQPTPLYSPALSHIQDTSVSTPGGLSALPGPNPSHAALMSTFNVSPLASIMPQAALPLKSLVLDLDETLVHSVHACPRGPYDLALKVSIEQVAVTFYVRFRPHLRLFLSTVASWYRLAVFTASLPPYGNPLIDVLDGGRGIFAARLFRDSCTQVGPAFVKDLTLVERDLSRVAIIDNTPGAYLHHQENAIPIETWTDDASDTALLALLPFLDALRCASDVRSVLRLRVAPPPVVHSSPGDV